MVISLRDQAVVRPVGEVAERVTPDVASLPDGGKKTREDFFCSERPRAASPALELLAGRIPSSPVIVPDRSENLPPRLVPLQPEDGSPVHFPLQRESPSPVIVTKRPENLPPVIVPRRLENAPPLLVPLQPENVGADRSSSSASSGEGRGEALAARREEIQRFMMEFPNAIPGAARVEFYPERGATKCLVMVRQIHDWEDLSEEKKRAIIAAQQDVETILDYLMLHPVVSMDRVYYEGVTSAVASANEVLTSTEAFLQQIRMITSSQWEEGERWELLNSLLDNDDSVGREWHELKLLRLNRSLAEKLDQAEPQRRWERDPMSAVRNLSGQHGLRIMRSEVDHLNQRAVEAFQGKMTREGWHAITVEREDLLLHIVSRDEESPIAYSVYGAGHQWREAVNRYNRQAPADQRIALILITPTMVAQYYRETERPGSPQDLTEGMSPSEWVEHSLSGRVTALMAGHRLAEYLAGLEPEQQELFIEEHDLLSRVVQRLEQVAPGGYSKILPSLTVYRAIPPEVIERAVGLHLFELRSGDPDSIRVACESLIKLRSHRGCGELGEQGRLVVEELNSILGRSEDPKVLIAALLALNAMGPESFRAIATVNVLLRHSDQSVVAHAALILGRTYSNCAN